tara:strand:+ start:275 stop:1279 length:1005 start_codon:yes stop_codon:yes gene_type:complete
MKIINFDTINKILYRYPITNINYLVNKSTLDMNILYNNTNKYYIIKPKGKKCYLWFTYINKKLLCILILLNSKNINDIKNEFYELDITFDNELCYNNTLVTGYYFKHKKKYNYVVLDNINNYNDYNYIIEKNNFNKVFSEKLKLLNVILPKINNTNTTFVKIPVIFNTNENLFKYINKINYNIYSIELFSEYGYNGMYLINKNLFNNNNNNSICTFKITPCVNEDLYNLLINDNGNEIFYDIALINSYKTSIFMNKLFRNIRENENIDYLEESESEELFEDIKLDKYVYLGKSYLIDCEFNNKFKKWVPLNLSKNKLIEKKELLLILEKKIIFV